MPTLAAYPGMVQRARKREGLRVCRAAWLVGVSVREYREIEAGDRTPGPDTYQRISELYCWPQTFVADRAERASGYGSHRPPEGQSRRANRR
jgi:transcriptional regulator with XRE-family HTH domain